MENTGREGKIGDGVEGNIQTSLKIPIKILHRFQTINTTSYFNQHIPQSPLPEYLSPAPFLSGFLVR